MEDLVGGGSVYLSIITPSATTATMEASHPTYRTSSGRPDALGHLPPCLSDSGRTASIQPRVASSDWLAGTQLL